MKSFNEYQMSDPWRWCFDVLEKHQITSKLLSDKTGTPRSTARALFNGTNQTPRYEFLLKILRLCIDLENGDFIFGPLDIPNEERIAEPVSEPEEFAIDDFL